MRVSRFEPLEGVHFNVFAFIAILLAGIIFPDGLFVGRDLEDVRPVPLKQDVAVGQNRRVMDGAGPHLPFEGTVRRDDGEAMRGVVRAQQPARWTCLFGGAGHGQPR